MSWRMGSEVFQVAIAAQKAYALISVDLTPAACRSADNSSHLSRHQ